MSCHSYFLVHELTIGFVLTRIAGTGLKVQCPDEVAVIELLMSVKPDASFALARPVP